MTLQDLGRTIGLLAALAVLETGCPKSSPTADAGAPALGALPSAAPAAPAESASAVRPCALERGFRGTIGPKLEVLARLERDGAALRGHYLYTRVGSDLPLSGTLSASGALTLTEGDAANPSGRFTGTCEADGHLRGTWSKPGDAQPLAFDLEPIPPRDEMVVATRRKARRFAPKPSPGARPAGGFAFEPKAACVEEVTWPEIYGARTPQDEIAINRALTNDAWVLAESSGGAQLRACLVGERVTASRSFEVLLNRSGIFAVRERETTRYEGGTHPWDPGVETWLAFDTRTGAAIGKKDLLPAGKPATAALSRLLDRCLVAYVRDVVGGEAAALADMRERVSLGNLALLVLPTDRGLHFAATGYAPPARVLEGEGPTLTWASLVAAGALPAEGAATRIWAGVQPSAATDDPCVKATATRP
ncbi:hypothetical protein BH11MYX4_BH11MYX4_53680 [soil metagenome]